MAITRFVDANNPGFVELQLKDAFGKAHIFVEKIPVVTETDLSADSAYPIDTSIACEIQERFIDNSGRSLVRVDTERPWHIESKEGCTIFTVFSFQVAEDR